MGIAHHFISQNAVDAVVIEVHQPVDPFHLIVSQRATFNPYK
jgi:hypothetical protein